MDENTMLEGTEAEGILEAKPLSLNYKWKFFNIIIIGISFMFLFTAFQTCQTLEVLILEAANNETQGHAGSGYTSLTIIYLSFAVFSWIAPVVVAFLSGKWSLIFGATFYCLFVGMFLKPMAVTLYITSVLIGFGSTVLWTAQGKLLNENSSLETMGRNTGIFWALFQCGFLLGNLFIFLRLQGVDTITESVRTPLFIGLLAVGGFGIFIMFAIRPGPKNRDDNLEKNPIRSIVGSFKLFLRKEMLLLSFMFLYTGLETTFWASVFMTSVGHTLYFASTAKQLIGLCGICVGVGEIVGSMLFTLFGNLSPRRRPGRDLAVFLGFILHMVAFMLVYLNLPASSPLYDSSEPTTINPNKYLILLAAFLLGFGDSCLITQIYPMLSFVFPSNMAEACAIFKFVQSAAMGIAFVYSQYMLIYQQLINLVVWAALAAITFFIVECRNKRQVINSYVAIQEES